MHNHPLQAVRDLFCSSRNLMGLGRLVSLLILILSVTLGLLVLTTGAVAQAFGAEVAAVFTFGKVLIALPMWAGVVLMFSFVCRM